MLARLMVVVSVVAGTALAEKPVVGLLEARRGFTTKLLPLQADPSTLEVPPADLFSIVKYSGPAGELKAYLGKAPKGARGKLPAMIWIGGGFPVGGMDAAAWEDQDPANDQSAKQYRLAGMIMMYPTFRGTLGNPGHEEGFLGEVDDVLAAIEYLRSVPSVDPERIYLGGHSTGGTLALLCAEATNRVRGVFAFGPTDDVGGYGPEYLPFDLKDDRERAMRAPIRYLDAVRVPTFVIEGDSGNSNLEPLRAMEARSKNPKLTFIAVKGGSHFDILASTNELIAAQLGSAKGATAPSLTAGAVNEAASRSRTAPRVIHDPAGWEMTLPPGFARMPQFQDDQTPHVYGFHSGQPDFAVVGIQRVPGRIDKECVSAAAVAKAGAPGEGHEVSRVRWGRFQLCATRSIQRRGKVSLVITYVEVPLKPQGLNLYVTGSLSNEPALRALVEQLVASLKGETYWRE